MRLSFMIGIIALNLTNCHAKPQEKSMKLNDVPNEKISPELQETLKNLAKMTNEQKLNALTELTYSANNFSLKLYKNVVSPDRRNFVLSVFATFQSMGLIAWGSTEETKRQIHRILKLPGNRPNIFTGFEEIHRRFKGDKGAWSPLNSLSIHKDSPVTSDFQNISERIFSAEMSVLSNESPGTMDIYSGADFQCCTRSEENLYPLTFTNADGTKTEYDEYVRLTGKYRHGQLPEIKATFVEIPCPQFECSKTDEPKMTSTRMFILFPNRPSDFHDLEMNIERLSINRLSTGDLRKVNITVPVKFQHNEGSIIDTLTGMGLTRMFGKNAEISLTTPQIDIQKFDHHGSFDITKDDDSITVPGLNDENIPKVTVDRPFITIITTSDENPIILHIARVTSLEDE